MTDEQMRVKIAEALGWTKISNGWTIYWINSRKEIICRLDFTSDLNACHEMEDSLCGRFENGQWLMNVYEEMIHPRASARQRCESFLRVRGLWRDEPVKEEPK